MAAPAKLAFVITELEVGGAECCLVNLATRIDRQQFEPAVYSIRPRPAPGQDTLVKDLENAGIGVQFLDIHSKWQFLGAVSRLTRLLRQQEPQLVQTFLYHANTIGTLAARRARVRHVVTGVRVADPRRSRAWIERLLTSDVDRIVCVSRGVAEHCQARLGVRKDKLVVIPNGVELSRFAGVKPLDLTELGVPPERRAIVYVGRLDPQKGLDDLLRVAPRILDELPQHELVLVGEGSQRAALTRLAVQLEIQSRVQLIGWRDDVPAVLAAAQMLVLPSRWEGMPNVVLEAMAAGKPIVATQVEGVAELLGECADEQSVDVGDYGRFAEMIIQLAQNPQLAAELGRRNRERAAGEFSLDAMVANYERLYAEILAG